MTADTVWAVVVAAGRGSRYGRPKQYDRIRGRTVLEWSLGTARAACDGVVAVVPAADVEEVARALGHMVTVPGGAARGPTGVDAVVGGGATRSESVRAGLVAVPESVGIVVVHDAARPLAGPELWAAAIAAVRAGADAALCAVPVTDTVKRVRGRRVMATMERDGLMAVQTPQAFAAGALRAAHAGGGEATDDGALLEAMGATVVVVAGSDANVKITHPRDLEMAVALAGERAAGERGAGGRGNRTAIRVGHGFDVHPFADDAARPLVLGGVTLAGERGLAGHSDADVVAHAVADALLGAAGLGDMGQLFPDTDPAWSGADSLGLLGQVVGRLAVGGWSAANVDVTVVLEAPRLAPHLGAMGETLSGVVGAPVSVKAKRAENLGAIGRREGIACWAVALLDRS